MVARAWAMAAVVSALRVRAPALFGALRCVVLVVTIVSSAWVTEGARDLEFCLSSARFPNGEELTCPPAVESRGDGIDAAAGQQMETVRSVLLGGVPAYLLGGAAAGWGWCQRW